MNLDELYSKEHCKMIAAWLMQWLLDYKSNYRQIEDHPLYPYRDELKDHHMFLHFLWAPYSPELIREALARDGIYVETALKYHMKSGVVSIVGAEELIAMTWDTETDPTGCHALFSVTIQYLTGRRAFFTATIHYLNQKEKERENHETGN